MKSNLFLSFLLLLICNSSFAQTELWGMTRWGGTNSYGTIFKTDGNGNNPQQVYSFSLGNDGHDPQGSLFEASNHKLYGMTYEGGVYNKGVLFEYDRITNTYTKKIDFDSTNGASPAGSLVQTSNGKLFGMTAFGGNFNKGVLFEYDINLNTLSKLVDFDGVNNGANPYSNSLIEASNGKLYGLTPGGGINNNGVIFEFDYVSNTFTKKVDFPTQATGTSARGELLEVSNGVFYGLAAWGGATSDGFIFTYDLNSNTYTHKKDFLDSITGSYPNGSLIKASNGKLYGLAYGGPGYQGTLFEYDTASNSFTRVVDFGNLLSNTWEPYGSLLQASNGKLYGMSAFGGSGGGDLFEYDIIGNQYTLKVDLDSAFNGSEPRYTHLIEVNTDTTYLVWPGDCNLDLIVNNVDFLSYGLAYNDTGAIRANASLNWTGQPCAPWVNFFSSGINYKHADCNGDGVVDSSDANAINLNYGQSHPLRSGQQLTGIVDFNLVADRNAVAPGDTVTFEIQLANSTTPVDSIYGIAYSLMFDQTLVDTTQILIDYSNSVLGSMHVNMHSFEKDFYTSGQVDAAVTRIDKNNAVSVGGVLGTLRIITSAAVTSLSNLLVTPVNVYAISLSGDTIGFNAIPDSVSVDPILLGIEGSTLGQEFTCFPNPAKNQFTLKIKNEVINAVEIFDTRGSKVYSSVPLSGEVIIPCTHLATGIYSVKVVTDDHVLHQKIQITQ